MNENELRRKYPRASETFIRLNKDKDHHSRSSSKSQRMARRKMETLLDKAKMASSFCLVHVGVEFFANHGIELDEDNRRFTVKPMLDALVSIGLAPSDKEIKTHVRQRMDANNPYI